jgi:hypothetical protein
VRWIYRPPEASLLTLGEWNTGEGWDGGYLCFTDTLEVAQQWARALRDGRIPADDADSALNTPG